MITRQFDFNFKILFVGFVFLFYTGYTHAEKIPILDPVESSTDKKIEEKKQINMIVNLFGQEVNHLYRGCVIVHFSDGSTVTKIQ
jgi:hypothetical protein